ncbi:MAG TPA: D-alanine--D-alanine ligase [candidate division WWE3 bacterium]|uniref:D-alanine--D-alanine ligase n=1 Tax=candidate division WWE3 bacterium TaxID=2053526 RepID=A0A7C1SQE9_UNCKA|nr:D-alanine--D-alanine ligase [candidate division WWE3 bacterium]
MRKKIAVLMGGPSPEYEVSISSGNNVVENLDGIRFEVSPVVIGKDGSFPFPLEQLSKFDVAFLALHGPFGEDGTIQAILEQIGLPYTGSAVAASRLGMDKIASKMLFRMKGIPTPEFRVVDSVDELANTAQLYGYPLVVKPSNQGSSVGVSIVRDPSTLVAAFTSASQFGPVIAEKYIKGREIQAGILGDEPLPLIEILPKKDFFDYEAKYNSDLAEEIVPAPLDKKTTEEIQKLGLRAFRALACRGLGRVDLFLQDDGEIFVFEVNTIPGLTKNSLFPKEAAAAGITFPALLERIIDLALNDES